jgi:2-C-methyl-D-erythritol 4-phosphate cytidylyltransferase
MPVADTLKQSLDGGAVIEATVARTGLWQAQTPQMFRLGDLHTALSSAVGAQAELTDEASAIERLGGKPLLVQGATRNFKVTQQADWDLMELVLRARSQ